MEPYSHPFAAPRSLHWEAAFFFGFEFCQRDGEGSPDGWGLWSPHPSGDPITIAVAVLAIIYRLFCTAKSAVIAAITAKLQFFVSCKIAAISAFLQQIVKVKITTCLMSAVRALALAVSDFKAKECGAFFRCPLVERLFRAELVQAFICQCFNLCHGVTLGDLAHDLV